MSYKHESRPVTMTGSELVEYATAVAMWVLGKSFDSLGRIPGTMKMDDGNTWSAEQLSEKFRLTYGMAICRARAEDELTAALELAPIHYEVPSVRANGGDARDEDDLNDISKEEA